MMPEMDGWEFLVHVDEDPQLHQVPVALMSAHPSVRRAFDRGKGQPVAESFLLPKPLNLLRLLSIVHSIVPDPSPTA
jgi:CheY-like chemotaxis protein